MEPGTVLTHATASATFLAYVVALGLRLRPAAESTDWSRIWWTLGCVLLILHVGCAFHFIHHWSHRAAYEATARQTADVTGFDSGSGLFFNYAVMAVWVCDVCWWWWARSHYESRPRMVAGLIHGFLAFMWFNATAVFGHGAIRWLGLAAWVLLIVLCWRRISAQHTRSASKSVGRHF